jgi:hypothetical protein
MALSWGARTDLGCTRSHPWYCRARAQRVYADTDLSGYRSHNSLRQTPGSRLDSQCSWCRSGILDSNCSHGRPSKKRRSLGAPWRGPRPSGHPRWRPPQHPREKDDSRPRWASVRCRPFTSPENSSETRSATESCDPPTKFRPALSGDLPLLADGTAVSMGEWYLPQVSGSCLFFHPTGVGIIERIQDKNPVNIKIEK